LLTIRGRRINWSKLNPIVYLLISVLLSTTIAAKLLLPLNQTIQSTNYTLFVLFLIGIPLAAIAYIIIKVRALQFSDKIGFITLWATGNPFGYEYLYLWVPAPVAYLLSIKWNKNNVNFFGSKRTKLLVALCFTIAILMPNAVAFTGITLVQTTAKNYGSIKEKVSYIDDRVNALTFYTWVFRANLDNWKFLLSGAGQCGEMATASYNLM
jgi:phosphotransferase system  glucose/maltose/N-acetylglucosamine-specific IIC component